MLTLNERQAVIEANLSLIIRAFEDLCGNLEGRLLEALTRLFAQNVRIYAYLMDATQQREKLTGVPAGGWESSETNGENAPTDCFGDLLRAQRAHSLLR